MTPTHHSLKHVRALVEEIRTFLNSGDHTNSPRMTEKASEFAAVARATNERLQRCAEWMQNGQRTAAVQFANMQPDLIEMTTTLRFERLDQWAECSATYGWERAPAIKEEIASRLSTAYAEERQWDELLKRHRRLALQKAGIVPRLATLREIAAADHTSPFWRNDIAVLEEERARQLVDAGEVAIRHQDYAKIDRFLKEYKAESWISAPPDRLVALHAQSVAVFHVQRSLPSLAGEIGAAIRRQNGTQVLALLSQWNEVVGDVRRVKPDWQPPAALMVAVQPAIEYAAQVDDHKRVAEFHADLQQLHVGIDSNAGSEEIALLVAKVESHGMGIPPATRKALSELRHSEATSTALNTAMIVSVIMAMVVLIIVAFFIGRSLMQNAPKATPATDDTTIGRESDE